MMASKLKQILLFFGIILLFTNCEERTLVGSPDVNVFKAEFSITSKSNTSSHLIVNGTVKNIDESTYHPTWYVEAEFYSDSTYSFKLGGTYYSLYYTLAPGEATNWRLTFGDDLVNEEEYPNFAIKNLQAYTPRE